jgi:hypothetical protein
MLGMIHGDVGEGAFWGMVRYGQVRDLTYSMVVLLMVLWLTSLFGLLGTRR